MKLKAEKKTILKVEYADLEAFAESVYGGNLEIPAIEETNNDVSLEYTVTGEISKWNLSDAEKIRAGFYPHYCTGLVLDLLCFDGRIERGDYVIRVSW